MLTLLRCALALLLVGMLPRAHAQSSGDIHRCTDARGQPVFTDRQCADLGATAVAPTTGPPPGVVSAPATSPGALSLGPPPVLCASSVGQLKQQLIDAFAVRDANRLAGLMLWNGYGKAGVVRSIESLATLMKQPLLDVTIGEPAVPAPEPQSSNLYDASQPLGSIAGARATASDQQTAGDPAIPLPEPPPPRENPPNELVVETPSRDASGEPQLTHFAVVEKSGCRWLRRLD